MRMFSVLVLAAGLAAPAVPSGAAEPAGGEVLTLLVMDPLSANLACDCVAGFAQRNYDALGAWLADRLGRPVRVMYSDELGEGIDLAGGRIDLVVGKENAVRYDAAERRLDLRPIARLTGQDGTTTLTGLAVVRQDDPARSVKDLAGHRLLFGPAYAPEKHAAAWALLKAAGLEPPARPAVIPTCTGAAAALVEKQADAAFVSSYALPLIEGCGTVDPGMLRVIGRTEPVPFIVLFRDAGLPAETADRIRDLLVRTLAGHPELLKKLESKSGFVPYAEEPPAQKKTR